MGADATDTSQRLRPRHAWASYVVLVVTLLMTAGVVYYVKHTAESKSRARFEGLARRTRDDIKRRLETYVALLRAGAGLLAASEQVSHEEFRAFVEQLDLGQRYQGIQGIGYAARVRPEELENFLAGARREFGRDFRLQPEHEREEYYPITYLEPRDRRNQAAVGYDMFSEPTRRAAMEQARDTGAPAASGKVTLVQELDEAGKQAGFLIYFPVYRNGRAPTTTAERRAAIRGFVYSPFRTDDLLRGIFGSDQTPQIAFRIYDGDRPDPHSLLHESHPPDASDAATNFTGIEQMEIEGRRWTLWYASRPNIESDIEHQLVPYLGLGGLAASLVLFGLTRAQARARSAAERAAGEVRSSEASLRASENRFRTMIEQSPVAITLFAPDGTMLQANRAWEKLWGVTAVQVAGYNVLRDRQLRAKGLIPLFERGFAGEAAALPPLNYDPSLTVGSAAAGRADAGRWVQAVIYPVKNPDGGVREVVLMQEDITERRRAEAEAIESEGRFRALSEATFDGIIVHEHDRIIEANPGFAQMFGYRLDELAGLCVPDLFAEESREVVRRNLAEDVAHPYEVTARRKDGTIFNLEVTGKEHVYRGRPVRVTAVRDITDRKLLEEQLRARALQLAEANRLKDEFLATLSHELRTPLTAILGWSRMLTMGALDAGAARRAIETIERNARAQARLIDELLDVSRIITGKLRLEVSEVSLCAVLEAAVEGVRPAAEAKGMGMKVHCEAADDRTAGDPARLQQVAWNLLSNAIKFTPRGGHIEARVRRVNDHLELRVSDTGEGVAAKFLPFIFDRFRQADGSITREHGGLGLG
ncbi:MAG: CHASE domain-containing sensor histidine kinase, partial [Pyrinomonadaceae bacterium]